MSAIRSSSLTWNIQEGIIIGKYGFVCIFWKLPVKKVSVWYMLSRAGECDGNRDPFHCVGHQKPFSEAFQNAFICNDAFAAVWKQENSM